MALPQATIEQVVSWLVPIFPQHSLDIITNSVKHPSNQVNPLDEQRLLQHCIDDLLSLRTLKEATAVKNQKPNQVEEITLAGKFPCCIFISAFYLCKKRHSWFYKDRVYIVLFFGNLNVYIY